MLNMQEINIEYDKPIVDKDDDHAIINEWDEQTKNEEYIINESKR